MELWQKGELEAGRDYIATTVLPDLQCQLEDLKQGRVSVGKFCEHPSKAAGIRTLMERIAGLAHPDRHAVRYYASLTGHYSAVRRALDRGDAVPPVAIASYDDLLDDIRAGLYPKYRVEEVA